MPLREAYRLRAFLPTGIVQREAVAATTLRGGTAAARTFAAATAGGLPAQQPDNQGNREQKGGTEDEWAEVTDPKTGGRYWWNRATGETTNLGEPRPAPRFSGPHAAGPGAGGTAAPGGAAGSAAAPAQRDNTFGLAFAGIALGLCVGWATQYMP